MIKFSKETVIMFDIDDTLVMWSKPESEDLIDFLDPYSGMTIRLKPHKKHIEILKSHYVRGYTVMVWSAGGVEWANTVVNTLGISDFVDGVLSKPVKFVDDLPATEILGTRLYLDDKD